MKLAKIDCGCPECGYPDSKRLTIHADTRTRTVWATGVHINGSEEVDLPGHEGLSRTAWVEAVTDDLWEIYGKGAGDRHLVYLR